jgi:hypothetical protein
VAVIRAQTIGASLKPFYPNLREGHALAMLLDSRGTA